MPYYRIHACVNYYFCVKAANEEEAKVKAAEIEFENEDCFGDIEIETTGEKMNYIKFDPFFDPLLQTYEEMCND
jgi:phosphopantetheinyl transferase (holo-ACP synthase)